MAPQNGEIEEEKTPTSQFRRFDIVTDELDHHYANNNNSGSNCFTNSSSAVHKKIMKEWRILEKDLPDLIYVRVYDRRIDLLRAVIVGPAGTPYHDGLFFFDIAFPPDYPNRPPKVHFRSFGLRLNPNLYVTGYVCLSLLNTWTGNRNEVWKPAESTVLQILVSIQGLVLNEKPYYNEPFIGIYPGRVKKSIAYSENVFVLSCKTMVYLLRKPPRNFEKFVAAHFRERAEEILGACYAYTTGRAGIGCYGASNAADSICVPNKLFMTAMENVWGELVDAFKRNGSSVSHFIEQMKEINENKETLSREKERKEKVVKETNFEKFIGMIKKILGFEKGGKSIEKTIEGKNCT